MIPSDQKIDKDHLIKSAAIGLTAALSGIAFFLFQSKYFEPGHGSLLVLYMVLSVALIIPLYFSKKGWTVFVAFVLALILVYAFFKFDWRRTYIQGGESGNPFLLEAYITDYETFEDHYFPWFSSAPRWVSFADDCYKPILEKDMIKDNCRSLSLIQNHYNIDLRDVIDRHYQKMRTTAQMLQQGQLMDKQQYKNCLAQKRCAVIPLMRSDIQNHNDPEAQMVSQQFWSLIEDDKISPEVCDFIDLCRTMRSLNVLPIATTGAL